MKIRKAYQGTVPENKILDTYSTSQTDTYSCNYVNIANTYSTTETRIGTWIDGKPIYRKVITGLKTPTNADTWTVKASISNVDTMVKLDGFFFGNDGRAMSLNFPQPSYYSCVSFINGNIEIRVASNWVNKDCFVITEYTKTTD